MAIVISKPCIAGDTLWELQTATSELYMMMRDTEMYDFPVPQIEISLRGTVIAQIEESARVHFETWNFKPIEFFSTFSDVDTLTFTSESKHLKEQAVASNLYSTLLVFEEYNNNKYIPCMEWNGFKRELDTIADMLLALSTVFGCAYRAQLDEEMKDTNEVKEL